MSRQEQSEDRGSSMPFGNFFYRGPTKRERERTRATAARIRNRAIIHAAKRARPLHGQARMNMSQQHLYHFDMAFKTQDELAIHRAGQLRLKYLNELERRNNRPSRKRAA